MPRGMLWALQAAPRAPRWPAQARCHAQQARCDHLGHCCLQASLSGDLYQFWRPLSANIGASDGVVPPSRPKLTRIQSRHRVATVRREFNSLFFQSKSESALLLWKNRELNSI